MAISCSFGLEVKTLFSTRIFLITAYTIIAIPTVLLNLLVFVAIWKTPSLQKPSQILLANLALADFLVGVVADPSIAFSNLAITNEWTHSFCHSWIILGPAAYCLGAVSLYTLAIISIDRFLAIKLKFTYRTVVTLKRLIYTLISCWLINGGLYIVVVVSLFKNIPSTAFLTLVALYIAVLLCTITSFYSMAFYHLKKATSQVSTNNSNEPAPNTSPNFDVTKYRRSLHTMLIVLFAIFVFYLPYFCFAIFESIFREVAMISHFTRVGEFFLAVNSVVNPILYLWRMKDLRQAVKDTVRRFLKL